MEHTFIYLFPIPNCLMFIYNQPHYLTQPQMFIPLIVLLYIPSNCRATTAPIDNFPFFGNCPPKNAFRPYSSLSLNIYSSGLPIYPPPIPSLACSVTASDSILPCKRYPFTSHWHSTSALLPLICRRFISL